MDCEKIRSELVAYLDGELGDRAADEVRSHLERCPACKLEAEQLLAAGTALDEIADIEPSPDFTARTVQRAMAAPALAPISRVQLLRRLVPAIAAAAVILVAALWIVLPSGPQSIDSLPPAEREIVANMEILENLELLEDMELLDNLDLLLAYDEEDFDSLYEAPDSSEEMPKKKS